MNEIYLSDTQQLAISQGRLALRSGLEFKVGGYAGTGKTTVAQLICEGLHVAYCAFMGKAVNVMRKKGMKSATTIHSLLYDWDDDAQKFIRKLNIPANYICVDEGSTVNVNLWKDLVRHGKPILVLGDPGQLEPVGDDAKLMAQPNIILDKIFRNEGSIADFAAKVRVGEWLDEGNYGDVIVKNKADWKFERGSRIICGFNRTRVAFNRLIRQQLGRNGSFVEGEELICLNNNNGMFNGQMFTIKRIVGERGTNVKCDIILDDGTETTKLLWLGHLNRGHKMDWNSFPSKAIVCDYAYAITCHKMIGSEEENVVVWDEQCDLWNPIKWRYTAVTRATEKVTVYV